MNWFRKHLQARERASRIGILGSTPELRDLVGKLGFRRVDVLDRDKGMFLQMTKLRTGTSKESFVKGDWQETLGIRKGYYGAVLSDLTGGNIAYDEREEFYKSIACALEENGVFLDKCLTHPRPHEDLEELLEEYEWWPINWQTVNWFNCQVFFCSTLLERSERVDTSDFYGTLLERPHRDNLSRILQMMPQVTPKDMVWHYGRRWNEIKYMYEKNLVAKETVEERKGSPYYRRMKCIAWMRR